MATRLKPAHGLNGAHTAGIFADMTIDGPLIGTLVVVVDRAKNLPNRKTIGKQDPYCAARLGKEAKKTETDRRGGQTPRWDQELRFTVHDSPDYYQLKVSVFNDDKKTDIIGETWVTLKEVIVPGGGQNDLWHTLSCKGKYAGEIRIEITYYDTRPKPERSERLANPLMNYSQDDVREGLNGPRQPKAATRRRPLPSDPTTGTPASPVGMIDLQQTPPRRYQSPGQIPSRSPLQHVEYHTPPNRLTHPQDHSSSTNIHPYSTVPPGTPPNQGFRYANNDSLDSMPDYLDDVGSGLNSGRHRSNFYDYHSGQQPVHQFLSEDDFQPASPTGPPPPPPAHRLHTNSSRVSPSPTTSSQDLRRSPNGSEHHPNSYEDLRHSSSSTFGEFPLNPQSHQRQQPNHSHSMNEVQFRASTGQRDYPQFPPRHYSYDERFNPHPMGNLGVVQPGSEDVLIPVDSEQFHAHRHSFSNQPPFDDPRYGQVPSPAPLNLSGRGSAASVGDAASVGGSTRFSNASEMYGTVSSRTSYSSGLLQNRPPSRHAEDLISGVGYGLPPVPPTLVAGMDPTIAKEISERIYQEKRASASQQQGNSPRGRYQDYPPPSQSRSQTHSHSNNMQTPFVPAAASFGDDRSGPFNGAKPGATSPDPSAPVKRKSISPNPVMSGVPFGPDSYNALNPATSGSAPSSFQKSSSPTVEYNFDAKIITHDGREIDPSDHIPESNYAPLLEPRGPKYASQQPDRDQRSSPTRTQRMQVPHLLKQHGRVQSMPAPQHSSGSEPSTPPAGRNRLQKKLHRNSAQPLTNSSPFTSATTYQGNNYAPGNLPHARTEDFSNQNIVPDIYAGSLGYRSAASPVTSAKPAIGGSHLPISRSGGGDPWALLQEMRNIDLGAGRARRRGH